jgi:hypothetical protein
MDTLKCQTIKCLHLALSISGRMDGWCWLFHMLSLFSSPRRRLLRMSSVVHILRVILDAGQTPNFYGYSWTTKIIHPRGSSSNLVAALHGLHTSLQEIIRCSVSSVQPGKRGDCRLLRSRPNQTFHRFLHLAPSLTPLILLMFIIYVC